MANLSVIHVVAGLEPRGGGTSRSVVQLADALAQLPDLEVTLLSQRLSGEPTIPSADIVDRRVIQSPSRLALKLGLPVRDEFRIGRTSIPALIHSHGLWLPVCHWASQVARRNGVR